MYFAVAPRKKAGFGALRVPREYGGGGASITELTQLWIDLAAADANLAQALRGHAALVEDRLWQHARGRDQTGWFDRFTAGEIAGNAWSEVGSTAIDTQQTVLTQQPDGGYRITGSKFYTTGTIYAEWADVYVRRVRPGLPDEFAIALVDTRAPGVGIVDDWDGFGQKGTGSGTTSFLDVPVPAVDVLPFGERFVYQTALYQLNLLATLTGIAQMIRGKASADQFRGPLGIAKMTRQVAVFGFLPLLNLVAILSVSIGLANLFPIPLLDGGHLLYYAVEAVLGRPLGERAQDVGFRLGLVLVLGLMLLTTWNDLVRLNLF